MQILTNLNLNKNELQNAVSQNLAVAPTSPKMGQFYFNTVDKKEYVYNGTEWVPTGGGSGTTYNLTKTGTATQGDINLVGSDGSTDTVSIVGTGDVVVSGDGSNINVYVEPALGLIAGDNITLTPDTPNNTLTIAATIPEEYVTQTELENYAQPKGDYATKSELNTGLDTKLGLAGGTMTGDINMNSRYINNLPLATQDSQPTTLKQLNDAIKGLGTIFNLKGSKATVADLPTTGNTLGDVWFVEETKSGWIWLTDSSSVARWEEFGPEIDLTGYMTKAGLLQSTGSVTDNAMSQKAVTDALSLKADTTALPKAVSKQTSTIAVGATTTSVTVDGYILAVNVFDNITKNEVLCDLTYTMGTVDTRTTVVVSIASAYTNLLNIVVTYIAV